MGFLSDALNAAYHAMDVGWSKFSGEPMPSELPKGTYEDRHAKQYSSYVVASDGQHNMKLLATVHYDELAKYGIAPNFHDTDFLKKPDIGFFNKIEVLAQQDIDRGDNVPLAKAAKAEAQARIEQTRIEQIQYMNLPKTVRGTSPIALTAVEAIDGMVGLGRPTGTPPTQHAQMTDTSSSTPPDRATMAPQPPATTVPDTHDTGGGSLGLVEEVEKAVVNAVKAIVGVVTGDGKDHTTPLSNTVAAGQTRPTGKHAIG